MRGNSAESCLLRSTIISTKFGSLSEHQLFHWFWNESNDCGVIFKLKALNRWFIGGAVGSTARRTLREDTSLGSVNIECLCSRSDFSLPQMLFPIMNSELGKFAGEDFHSWNFSNLESSKKTPALIPAHSSVAGAVALAYSWRRQLFVS